MPAAATFSAFPFREGSNIVGFSFSVCSTINNKYHFLEIIDNTA